MPELWPYSPESDIEEQITFNTSVFQTLSKDWRFSKRPARQLLNYRHVMANNTFLAAQELVRSNPAAEWFVPVWTEQTVADVAAVDTTIAVSEHHTYVAGGKAIVWGSAAHSTIVDVLSFASGTLTLTAAVGADYTDAIIMPIRTALPSGFQTGRQARYDSELYASFICTDYPDLAPAVDAAMDGIDYFSGVYAPVLSGALVGAESGQIIRSAEITDAEYGALAINELRTVTEERASVSWGLETEGKKRAFYNFVHAVRGKDQGFYAPHIGGVLRAYNATATTADVLPIYSDLADYTGRVVRVAGEVRAITGAITSGIYHRISFAATTAAPDEVMFLKLFRADSDVWSFQHRANVRADVNIPVIEVLE